MESEFVSCPLCNASVPHRTINSHIDSGCQTVSPGLKNAFSALRDAVNATPRKPSAELSKKRGAEEPLEQERLAQPTPPSTRHEATINANASLVEGPHAHDQSHAQAHASTSPGKPATTAARKASGQTTHKRAPLAELSRPTTLDAYIGQTHILGEGKMFRELIASDRVPSMVLWGPPGSGKTSMAKIIAKRTKHPFVSLSACTSGVADVRKAVDEAKKRRSLMQLPTILFIDEIHRFNKAQQDALLPVVEEGLIILIGATTENPSFTVNSALLSRCRVFVLEKLTPAEVELIMRNAVESCRATERQEGIRGPFTIANIDEVLSFLATMCDGDARSALNALEMAIVSSTLGVVEGQVNISIENVKEALQKSHLQYDKNGEEHYNIISALHKSMRGSDVDAALYWLGRMLEAGEDPKYIARRLVRFASEDIGLADPNALVQATACFTACTYVGMPECNVIVAQCVAYLSLAPKSISVYRAYNNVQKLIKEKPAYPVPLHLRNAPTGLMKSLGYGRDYQYNPECVGPVVQDYLPKELLGSKFYETESRKSK